MARGRSSSYRPPTYSIRIRPLRLPPKCAAECIGVSRAWWLIRRAAFAVFAAYLVISVIFLLVALTPDPNAGQFEEGSSQLQEYRQQRHLDEPIFDRYTRWVVDVTMLDWGQSHGTTVMGSKYGQGYPAGAPVTSLVANALWQTLRYVFPAVVLSVIGGTLIGLYTALRQNTLPDRVATSVASLGFSLPNFWLGAVLLALAGGGLLAAVSAETSRFVRTMILPTMILGTSLLAGQLRYARSQSLEYIDAEFIKLVRAKGARNRRVARHLLRNAAIPLLSLFFADMLGIVVLNIFVLEYVFAIQGLGELSLVAIQSRDMPVILGASIVIILFGIIGNLLHDFASLILDPRVE